jgi:predicted ATPase
MFSISLTNFRSFKNQTFNFSRFNVLIGENSSGKTSLFKFLLALKQTMQAPSNREINLLLQGEYADLGSYKESIYYHDDALPLRFTFAFSRAYHDFFISYMFPYASSKESKQKRRILSLFQDAESVRSEITYEMNKDLNIHENIKTSIQNSKIGSLFIEHSKKKQERITAVIPEAFCVIKFKDALDGAIYVIPGVKYSKDGFMSIIEGGSLYDQINKVLSIPDFEPEKKVSSEIQFLRDKAEKIFNKIAYLIVTQNYLRSILEGLEYINPINTHPSRVYLYKDPKMFAPINDLDDVVEFFSKKDTNRARIFKDFVRILKKVGIAEDIEIIQDDRLPVRELRVKVKDLLSNIKDVGYGVSLQLPIILKCLIAERFVTSDVKRLIMIEQPEVHLHPKLHAQIIDALLMLSTRTIYFIETHSEHIVRKLQVAVKSKKYDMVSEDVTIHYLLRVKKHSEVSIHSIGIMGMLEPTLPSGFFDNSYLLSKELL